eukprot:scaffold51757_cov42-Cyclotella_meneghiniana.AAC.18
MAALISSALTEILRGMVTADQLEKRRQGTMGSQPAAVVPTCCRGGKARGGGGGYEGRRRLVAEGVGVGVVIMVDYLLLLIFVGGWAVCWFSQIPNPNRLPNRKRIPWIFSRIRGN